MNAETFRARLKQRDKLIGTLLTLPTPALAEMCADAGLDWLFLDMEHGALEPDDVANIARAVGERCPCVVRVPINDRMWIGRVLDIGVAGIIVPQVNSVGQARAAVSAAKYPPAGIRGVGGARASGYGVHVREYLQTANELTTVIVQIEHRDAVRNVEEIAAVPGVDALLIGPSDLSASFGRPGQIDDPEVHAAIARVREVGMARGIPLSIFYGDVERSRQAMRDGFTLITCATDVGTYANALFPMRDALRNA